MKSSCLDIRQEILKISHFSGHGHIPSCFSVVEIIYGIYSVMKKDPRNPKWEDRDIFILSKGHAALTHYCVLAQLGYFDIKEVYSFGSFGSNFGCHADRHKVPGVEVSTGSLGHGIGVAAGVALGLKIKKSDRRVYVVIGDGESNEGTVWETVMVAVNAGLDNMTIVYDNNLSHGRGLQIQNAAGIFSSFGCDAVEVNGNDLEEFQLALARGNNGVKVIVANTLKGFGCRTLIDNHYEWHRKSPSDVELKKLLEELNEETI